MPASSHETRCQHVLRDLRRAHALVAEHVAGLEVVGSKLLSVLSRTARETLYRFASTEDKLLDALSRCREHAEFLRTKQSAANRLFLGKHVFNKQGFANYVLTQCRDGPGREIAGETVVERALSVLSEQDASLRDKLGQLRQQRADLQDAANGLLQHLEDSARFQLLPPTAKLNTDLRNALWVAFDVGYLPPAKHAAAEASGLSVLERGPIVAVFTRLLTAYATHLQAELPRLLARDRKDRLRAAARQFVDELDDNANSYEESTAELQQVIRAIAGLRFAFACEQHRDVGKVPMETRVGYQQLLETASPQVLERAITETLQRRILCRDDLRLLLYVSPVQAAITRLGI